MIVVHVTVSMAYEITRCSFDSICCQTRRVQHHYCSCCLSVNMTRVTVCHATDKLTDRVNVSQSCDCAYLSKRLLRISLYRFQYTVLYEADCSSPSTMSFSKNFIIVYSKLITVMFHSFDRKQFMRYSLLIKLLITLFYCVVFVVEMCSFFILPML